MIEVLIDIFIIILYHSLIFIYKFHMYYFLKTSSLVKAKNL